MPLLKKLEAWSFRLFGGIAPYFLKHVFEFKAMLERARIKIYPETYVSLMFFVAMLTIPISIISILFLVFFGLVIIMLSKLKFKKKLY